MTIYRMEAVENYDAATAALVDAGTQPTYCFTDQRYAGMSFDRVRRKILYAAIICPAATVTNDTGFALWNGSTSIAAGASYNARLGKNYSTAELDIDSRAVTFHQAFNTTSLVPAGIGGSDGTALRFTDTDANFVSEGPKLVDPRTGDLWMHAYGNDLACSVYLFRRADSFAQVISPLGPHGGSGHMTILGMTDDWVYVSSLDGAATFLQLTPRTIQAGEVAADYLLSYADFAFPAAAETAWYGFCVTADDSLYLFASQRSGTRGYSLYRFTPPSSAPLGGPTVGGGFADVTPWGAATGPNTGAGAYIVDGKPPFTQNSILSLPATGELACISILSPACTGAGVTDPLLLRIDCTYVSGASFDHQAGFITGYMTADWAPTTDPAAAAWAVQDLRLIDPDLDMHSFGFDAAYTRRWLAVTVQPVVAGVWTPDTGANHIIFVLYEFVSGAAPRAVREIGEGGWDQRYTDYAAAIGNPNVVEQSLIRDIALNEVFRDNGVFDAAKNAFWWAAARTLFQFDPAFDRDFGPVSHASPPFLRLSLERTVHINVRIGKKTRALPPPPSDAIPDAFAFAALTGQPLATVLTSETVTVGGLDAPAAVSVAGGLWSKNGGAFTAFAGTVAAGDTVAVEVLSSAANATAASATLTIGGISAAFSVTTVAVAVPPPVATTTISVTPGTFAAAVAAIPPAGDVLVLLGSGSYGAILYGGKRYAATVTFRGQAGVVCDYISLSNCAKMAWTDIEVVGNRNGYGVTAASACEDIAFARINNHHPDTIDSNGFLFRSSARISCTDGFSANRTTGFNVVDAVDIVIDGMEVRNYNDGILLAGWKNVVIRRCKFTDAYSPPGAHADAIQGFGTATNPRGDGLLVEDCLYIRGAGVATQGGFMEWAKNVVFRRLAVIGGMVNGISFSNCQTALVEDCLIAGYTDSFSKAIARSGSSDITFKDSQAGAFENYAGSGVNPNFQAINCHTLGSAPIGDVAVLNAWRATRLNVPAP